jgi:hypothetical protein
MRQLALDPVFGVSSLNSTLKKTGKRVHLGDKKPVQFIGCYQNGISKIWITSADHPGRMPERWRNPS